MVKPLESLAKLQLEHTQAILVIGLLTTIILATGIPKIQLQTDFQDSLPDTLDPIEAQEKVEANFGNSDSIIILFQVNDESKEKGFVTDVRDPNTLRTMMFLESELKEEPEVDTVNSMGSLFEEVPENKSSVKQRLAQTDASFTNRDFTATTMFVTLSEDMTEENVRDATQVIEENIEQSPKYPGLDVTITGTPVIRTTISDVLVSDSATTIAASSLLILGLLTISRGRVYGPITFVPLFMGLVWTLGFMGHFNIPLSFATISLGSMILGLGVEYGSFITERILEEMENNGIEQAITTTIPNTGRAIVGSSLTDGVGFMALLLATISFIRDLGITLALGEFLTVTSALVITPSLMLSYVRWKQ